jgi:DNA adenine methylase
MLARAKRSRGLRPAFKYHGGKSYVGKWIIPRLPDHETYVEPYAGGLNVLLNKPPCPVEVAGDLDAGLIGFYEVLRDRTEELLERIEPVQYSRATFDWAKGPSIADDPIEAAVRFLVRKRFSRGSLGRDFAWSKRVRGGRPGDLNAWETIKAELPRIARRLAHVELRCQDAVEVIRAFDGPDTLHYLDPPYPAGMRTARNVYTHEMSDADHSHLVEVIRCCRGMVAISSYPNWLYDEALADWDRIEIDGPNHAGQGRSKQRRTEVLWMNPWCWEGRFSLRG